MPTIILCKRANPVPGATPWKIQFTTQTYNIAKKTLEFVPLPEVHAYCLHYRMAPLQVFTQMVQIFRA